MIVEQIKQNIKTEEILQEGFWKTGDNKYIKISEIDDVLYLQKILFTLQKRQVAYKAFLKEYKSKMDISCCLAIHVVDQLKVKGHKMKTSIDFNFDTVGDLGLEDQMNYILNSMDELTKEKEVKEN